MKLKQFLVGIENKNKIRNILFSNRRYNQNSNNSIFSKESDAKINIESIKLKYGYNNYSSSKHLLDRINKIKKKYIDDYTQNNFKIDSKNLSIIYKMNNNFYKTLSISSSHNSIKNNFQLEKGKTIEEENIKNFKIEKPYIIKNEEFSIINRLNTDKINNYWNKYSTINNKNDIYEIKANKCKNIYPISKRIKMLKRIKKDIDKKSKNDSKSILINSHSNNSLGSSNIFHKNNSKISIFNEVFVNDNETPRSISYKKISTPNLIRIKSKPKLNVPYYNEYMNKEFISNKFL